MIVKGGNVLAVGQSKLRTNPANCDFEVPGVRERVSQHAEIDALTRCGNPKGAVVYVARIGRSGNIRLAKPCKSCQRKLIEAGVKRIVYTVDDFTFDLWPPE